MRKRFLIVNIIIVIAGFFIVGNKCSVHKQSTVENNYLNEVINTLNSVESIQKELPFKLRNPEFKTVKAISYGPYRKGQAPGVKGPTKKQILEDLNIIKKYWDFIRVYNADDDTKKVLEVIKENHLPVKVMLGIWLEGVNYKT